MIDGELLAAKVGRVGRTRGEPQVEVFTGIAWPSFVMTGEDCERAHGGEDMWLDVATGPTAYLVSIEPSAAASKAASKDRAPETLPALLAVRATGLCLSVCGSTRQTPGRGSSATASAFRASVLARAGQRCEFVNGYGVRCSATRKLEAHHVLDLLDGGSNDPVANGGALCRRRQATENLARDAYVRHFYGVDPEDPALYHLTIDSTRLPLEACVEAIAAASRARGAERIDELARVHPRATVDGAPRARAGGGPRSGRGPPVPSSYRRISLRRKTRSQLRRRSVASARTTSFPAPQLIVSLEPLAASIWSLPFPPE